MLKFSGLRSYRRSAEIDFNDFDLFAVIGDTGAGKSTIIEAMCLALYARQTWSGGGNLIDLIADGEGLLRVEFTFDADGHAWKVTRARRRSGASPVDKLQSVFNHVPMVNGAREVTKQVEELIGLNRDQFTRAVVMPQGRFDELLGSTESERNEILKSVLGLEDIDRTRTVTAALRDEIRQTRAVYVERRANLPDDPDRELASARANLEAADTRHQQLSGALDVITDPRRISKRVQPLLDTLERARAAVRPLDGNPVEDLEACKELYDRLRAEFNQATVDKQQAALDISDIDRSRAVALDGFSSRDLLTVAHARLTDSAESFPADLRRLETARGELTELETWPPPTEVPAEIIDELNAAEDASETARQDRESIRDRLRTARGLIKDLNEAHAAHAQANKRTDTAAARADDANREALSAAVALLEAESELRAARTTHEQVRHDNAVATVAQGHAPGDDCPVCGRVLPGGFEPQQAPNLGRANRLLTEAEAALKQARIVADTANTENARASEIVRAATEASRATANHVVELRSRVVEAGIDPDHIEEGIAAIGTAAANADEALQQAERAERDARWALSTAQGDIREAVVRHSEQVKTAKRALNDRRARLEDHNEIMRALPGGWQIAGPLNANLLAGLRDRCAAAVEMLDVLEIERSEAEERIRQADAVVARVRADKAQKVDGATRKVISDVDVYAARVREVAEAGRICATEAAVRDALVAADDQSSSDEANRVLSVFDTLIQRSELAATHARDETPYETLERGAIVAAGSRGDGDETPYETLERGATLAAGSRGDGDETPYETLERGATLAAGDGEPGGVHPYETPYESPDLGAIVLTVTATLAATQAVTVAAEAVSAVAAGVVSSSKTLIADALAAVGYGDVDSLLTAHGEAQSALRRAKMDVAAAVEKADAAAGVDRVLEVVEPYHDNLVVLTAALANNQFVDHLLDLREAELLAEASRRLRTISDNRFGFVADFGVKSISSGEIRAPQALSGGERFQASLALALALVEIASRGGGRLDAVFIDEGFGSLDANALDTALATLCKVAGGGKMVGLISHLRSVAEYVDRVMHVTRDDVTGSQISILSAEDRDRLLAADTRSGLIA